MAAKSKKRKTTKRVSSRKVVTSSPSVSSSRMEEKRSQNDFLALLITILIAALFIFFFVSNTSKQANAPVEDMTVLNPETRIALKEQNSSKEFGSAVLTPMGGKTKVTLMLSNAPKGVAQPAHIHTGSCDKIGGVVYPLTNVVDGQSETMIDASLTEIRTKLPLAINVHKSAAQSTVYVACGDMPM